MANKTQPTDVDVEDFLATVSAKRAEQARVVMGLMAEVTGLEPVMWGPSIIGYGERTYATSRGEERIAAAGLSPRSTALTIYLAHGFHQHGDLLDRLGPHTHSQSCLYLKKLDGVDLDVLRQLIARDYAASQNVVSCEVAQTAPKPADQGAVSSATAPTANPADIEAYLARVPTQARGHVDQLREIVASRIPEPTERISYGVLGFFTPGIRRAIAFVGGFADHASIYPVPKDPEIQALVAPYRRGKGTLWFSLEEPVPTEVVERVVDALLAQATASTATA